MRAAVLESSLNPREMSVGKAIERYVQLALYLLVLCGFVTLASTGQLELAASVLVGIALAIRGVLLLTGRNLVIRERWTTILTVAYVFVYFIDYFLLSRGFLPATVHLVLFTMVIRLFSLQRPRDQFMLAVLSFLMVLAAAVLTVGSVFLFCFAIFLLVAIVTFVLLEIQHSAASAAPQSAGSDAGGSSARMASGLVAIAPALMMMILAGSFLIFFLLPRVSSRYLSEYTPTSDLSTGFTDRVQLGRIGQIQQSSAVVMHIEIQNDVQGAYDLKWRGIALSTFDGRVWSNSFEQSQIRPQADGNYRLPPMASRPGEASGGRTIHYRVVMEPLGTNVFFLADRPETLRGNFRQLSADAGGAVYNLDGDHPIMGYEGESRLPEVDLEEVRLAPNVAPAGMDEYLKLPSLDPRVPKLALEITADQSSGYDKAAALEQYLSTHFGYTLELPRTLAADPLANFLFERKRGHCEYFASSMAVMLRTLRIPSRIVAGFRGGEFNDLTGQYLVRASDAHSWVEAYFSGYGWISFDPTPAGSVPSRNEWSRMQLYVDAVASFWREWIINYDNGHQRILGATAAAGGRQLLDEARRWGRRQHRILLRTARRAALQFVSFPLRWLAGIVMVAAFCTALVNIGRIGRALQARMLRAHPERAPRESAALWYDRMVRGLARRGWRKSPAQTPLDFVGAIQEAGLQSKVARFTQAYESARFGQSTDSARLLPELFAEIAATGRTTPHETSDRAVS
jgi:transglutaminase-like putative cysteine protease